VLLRLTVDARPVEVPEGATVLDAVPEYKVCAVRVEPVRAGADARPTVTAGTPGA
jgi:hypothetical protein